MNDQAPQLDPVIHAQARLRVVASLSVLDLDGKIAFPSLQGLLDISAGNLSVHLRKLEDAKYIKVTKTHRGRTPITYIALTSAGRSAFETYTEAIRSLIEPTEGDAS